MSKSLSNLLSHLSLIERNLHKLSKIYPREGIGQWGEQGKSKDVRVIYSDDQYKTAEHFWNILSKDGKTRIRETEKGEFLAVTIFPDGSNANYRVITSTSESPAIQYRIKGLKPIKIHFEKKGNKR